MHDRVLHNSVGIYILTCSICQVVPFITVRRSSRDPRTVPPTPAPRRQTLRPLEIPATSSRRRRDQQLVKLTLFSEGLSRLPRCLLRARGHPHVLQGRSELGVDLRKRGPVEAACAAVGSNPSCAQSTRPSQKLMAPSLGEEWHGRTVDLASLFFCLSSSLQDFISRGLVMSRACGAWVCLSESSLVKSS